MATLNQVMGLARAGGKTAVADMSGLAGGVGEIIRGVGGGGGSELASKYARQGSRFRGGLEKKIANVGSDLPRPERMVAQGKISPTRGIDDFTKPWSTSELAARRGPANIQPEARGALAGAGGSVASTTGGGTTQAANKAVQSGGGGALSDAVTGVGMFARRAAMGGAIGAVSSAAWGAGPGDFSLGGIAGGAAMGAVMGGAGGYGASRARSAGMFDRFAGKQMTMRNRFAGGQLTANTQGMRFVGGRQGGARRTGQVGWGRAGMYAGAGAGGILGSWAGNNMFGNSRRRKSQSTLNHYGEMF